MINGLKVKLKRKNTENHKFYENPLDLGIFLRFQDATKVLSTEKGSLNERLHQAYYDCGICHLSSNHFEDKFIRNNLCEIETLVDKGMESIKNVKLPLGYYFNPQKFKLHGRQTSKMANCIFQIYKYLVQLRTNQK